MRPLLFRMLVLLIVGLPLVACWGQTAEERPPHFTYEGPSGPSSWGQITTNYHKCSAGHQQSPINVDMRQVEHRVLPELSLHYQLSAIREVNNGHTIEDDVAPGDFLSFGDVEYQLLQFHFHHPSEHTLSGRQFPLEVHFVHRSSGGQLLVLAVFVAEGTEHPALEPLFDHLPRENQALSLRADPAALLPPKLNFVEYEGSLTTPPCTEGVTWLVLTDFITASPQQIGKFAALYPHNNRPLMPLNGRHLLSGT